MTSEITSPAANAELVRAGYRALSAGDVGECLARIAPDLIINLAELPGPQHGSETWRQGFEMMRHAFPDLKRTSRTSSPPRTRWPSGCGSAVPTPAGSSPRNGSVRTWPPCSVSSAERAEPHFHKTFSESFYVMEGTVRLYNGESGRTMTDEDWIAVWARHDQYPA
jgi:hypothetical protein